MLSWREKNIDQALKRYDSKLFLKRDKEKLHIMRVGYTAKAYEFDDICIINQERNDHYVMSLTEDWRIHSRPVEWGELPIMKRLREIDSHNPDSIINKMEEHNAKVDEAKQRNLLNKTEDAIREWHPIFKKSVSDINTSTMEKIDPRRKREKRIEAKLKLKGF